jgi:phosphohistidine phosphatase
MGRFLVERGVAFDRVRCSTARRAVDTWRRVSRAFDREVDEILEERLYLAGLEDLVGFVKNETNDVSSLLLVGHNPGFAELVLALCGDDPTGDLRRIERKLPTGAWVAIGFPVERWSDVERSRGRLLGFQVPRELR